MINNFTEDLLEEPVSTVVLQGAEPAVFHCSGTGYDDSWFVDGLPSISVNLTGRGLLSDSSVSSDGIVQSSLTVPATQVNNGSRIKCVIHNTSTSESSVATLTILPG